MLITYYEKESYEYHGSFCQKNGPFFCALFKCFELVKKTI